MQGYDSHCNLVLGDVEETIYVVEDEEDPDGDVKVRGGKVPETYLYLFLRMTDNHAQVRNALRKR
jgi:small nuclear ribonucleoprotein (snRNP)-like protein